MPRTAGTPTASIAMSELIIDTAEDVWTTGDGANVTPKAETDTYKVGSKCAELAIGADFPTAGTVPKVVGYTATDSTVNLNADVGPDATYAARYNYAKFWMKSSRATTAGFFQFGLDNANTFNTAVGVGHRNWDIPALPVANTWYRVIIPIPRTVTDNTELASVDGVGITATADPGTCTIWIDDIRLCRYEFGGDEDITLPSISTVAGEVFQMPFRTQFVTVHQLPVDVKLQYFLGTNVDTHVATDTDMGIEPLYSGQSAADLARVCSWLKVTLGTDLGADDVLSILVGG